MSKVQDHLPHVDVDVDMDVNVDMDVDVVLDADVVAVVCLDAVAV